MPFRILRIASLALFITLVQCKHAPIPARQCDPADLAPGPAPLCLEQLRDTLNSKSYVLISADRNTRLDTADTTDGALLDRTCRLAADLRSLGLTYAVARGHYGDDDGETSFLVLAPKSVQPALIYLGRKYNQDSIIVGDAGKHTLVFTTGIYQGKAYTIDWQYSGQEETTSHHTDIKDKTGAKLTFSLPFGDLFDFGNNKPRYKHIPPMAYEDAAKALGGAFEAPEVPDSSLSCAGR